jgi:hypothetical protein
MRAKHSLFTIFEYANAMMMPLNPIYTSHYVLVFNQFD